MIVAWRIDKEKRAGEAFSGEGARLHGGRWNHEGTGVVYLSESLALAALERFVHLGRGATRLRLVAIQARIPAALVTELSRRRLPLNWREEPPPDENKDVGTDWAKSGGSAVLKVPSVIVPQEFNYVLNPFHRDFAKIRRDKPVPFSFDPRMWK